MVHRMHPGSRLSRRWLLALVAGGACAGATAAQELEPTVEPAEDALEGVRFSTSGWETDFGRHTVPLTEISPGGPPRDGIPPIDDPVFESIDQASDWLANQEPVIALGVLDKDGTVASNGRAYPLQILIWHEIVNDVLDDVPVLVTFCPLCNTSVVFDRRLAPDNPDATVYDFGTTGNLRFSDLVMWDRQTESWWQQVTGDAIVGELAGQRLTMIPSQILSFEAFRESWPNGEVLSRSTGHQRPYGDNPYPGYDDIGSSPFRFEQETDDRLPAMQRVVGVELDDEAVAYTIEEDNLAKVVNDEIAGTPVAVFIGPGAASALDAVVIAESRDTGQAGVFERTLDSELLSFEIDGDTIRDEQTGSRWAYSGEAVEGPLEGSRLAPVTHVVVFWFAWAAFQPDTRIHPSDASSRDPPMARG